MGENFNTQQPLKLLVTYFASGDAYTEVVDSNSECMTPSEVANWIAADGFRFAKDDLTAIIKACCDRLAGFDEKVIVNKEGKGYE